MLPIKVMQHANTDGSPACTCLLLPHALTKQEVCPWALLLGSSPSLQVDVWSVGVLTYELFVGEAPFYHENAAETIKLIRGVSASFTPAASVASLLLACCLHPTPHLPTCTLHRQSHYTAHLLPCHHLPSALPPCRICRFTSLAACAS
jgi:serine/threonine protein kinase